MRKTQLLALFIASVFFLSSTQPVWAQARRSPNLATPVATSPAATATISAETATPSAVTEQRIQPTTDKDLTETSGKTKDKIVEILEQNPIGGLSWHNFLQFGIRRAIDQGVPANVVVLILLFPLIASIIAFSRHIIGLKGFGVYTPAVLSVAFVSTGIVNGIFLFITILAAAMIMRRVLKKLNLQYLPRTAMLLWGVSVFTLAVFIGLSFLPFSISFGINIFPILIIMLLTENFMETQLSSSQSEAIQLTGETLVTAIFCSLLISAEGVQRYVILQPELALILVGAFNIFVGRYAGLRFLEWIRFRSIID